MSTTDVLVIGGGVIGCSIALRLAEARLKVTLVERNTIGREASWAAAGMLSAQTHAAEGGAFFELGLRSRSMYKDFAGRLLDISGVDAEYQDQGTLCLTMNEQEGKEIDEWASWQQRSGLRVERLTPAEARKLEPSVSENAAGGVFLAEDHQVENRHLMESLQAALNRLGVEIVEGTEVNALAVNGQKCIGVVTASGGMTAGAVVLAAGSWSSSLLGTILPQVSVVPAKGQMLALRGDRLPFSHIIYGERCYLTPRKDGRIVVGSTIEYAGYDKSVTVSGISTLLEAARAIVPELDRFQIVELWAGLRPDTPDHLPILGPSGIDNLHLATGHFRNGILLAPVTAEIISESIVHNLPLPESARTFGLDRLREAFRDR